MRPLIATLALCTLAALPQAQTTPAADAMARSLQQRYQGIRDFSADFVHSYRGGVLNKRVTERGKVSVKKPGMMRWDYMQPERKTFVSDGRNIYSYMPLDRQVIINAVPPDSEAPTPTLFLAGKGNVTRDFTASNIESATPGTYGLKLVPKRAEADYDYLVLNLDPATFQIRGLQTVDLQGGESTFTFTNLKENRGLSDKEFAFQIPRGVDVVSDDKASR